jgi:hypothetical protein
MKTVTLTLSDTEDGNVNMGLDFGEAFDPESNAHAMATVLAQSVLANANSYKQIEDTAPEARVEPSRIITAND